MTIESSLLSRSISINQAPLMTFWRGSWLQSGACHKCRLYDFDEIALDCVPGQDAWDLLGHVYLAVGSYSNQTDIYPKSNTERQARTFLVGKKS